MASSPIVHEEVASQANTLIGEFAQVETARPLAEHDIAVGRPGRHLAIYPARAGYELQEELDFLTNRAMEPNIFFSGRFLAPAMPRLEDRVIRLMLMRDETDTHSRMRLMLPFSVEKPGFSVGASIVRAWANPFGPLGTPLLDREDAAENARQHVRSAGPAAIRPARDPRAAGHAAERPGGRPDPRRRRGTQSFGRHHRRA